jgi:hypothetical protein
MYDEAATSAEFRALAAQADQVFREFQRGVNPPGEWDRDAVLARSCVYAYLYERHFLESAQMLVDELRWLRRTGRPRPPRAPRNAVSVERFLEVRDELLDALLARFTRELAG